MKPFSQAAENNKAPILDILRRVFTAQHSVLEIGSGTGQHAAFFAQHLPHLHWQCSDLIENHNAIQQWLDDVRLDNVSAPIDLDVDRQPWHVKPVDAVFAANILHIMSWRQNINLFKGLPSILLPRAIVVVYGPFNYNGKYTSESNRNFDHWLKRRDTNQGIRDFERVNELAVDAGLELQEDYTMPANNRLLVWKRSE